MASIHPNKNWYKRAMQDELSDFLGKEKEKQDTYKEIFDATNVWAYPFSEVKKEGNEYFIDWIENNGWIYDIQKVQPGQTVADTAINRTPYWKVTSVDAANGKIYLTPIEPNPFASGVGAGGKILDEHDFDVLSGETEKKVVNNVLDGWNKGFVAEARDVAYLLSGTVPYNFGPNGAQGGWYNAHDTYSNRGGRKGMEAKDIVAQDAKTLQEKFGFEVPVAALEGRMSAERWNDFVSNPYSFTPKYLSPEELEWFQTPGEDYSNPQVMAKNIVKTGKHPPSIKYRNMILLQEAAKEDPKLEPLLKNSLLQLANLYHPSMKLMNFDVFWHCKETAVNIARDKGWNDVLSAYESAKDDDVLSSVIYAYEEKQDKAGLARLAENIHTPKALGIMLYTLMSLGMDDVIAKHFNHWNEVVKAAEESKEECTKYYSQDPRSYLSRWLAKRHR